MSYKSIEKARVSSTKFSVIIDQGLRIACNLLTDVLDISPEFIVGGLETHKPKEMRKAKKIDTPILSIFTDLSGDIEGTCGFHLEYKTAKSLIAELDGNHFVEDFGMAEEAALDEFATVILSEIINKLSEASGLNFMGNVTRIAKWNYKSMIQKGQPHFRFLVVPVTTIIYEEKYHGELVIVLEDMHQELLLTHLH